LNDDLLDERDVSAKTVFGGWAWLMRGHLLCGARHDGLLVRLGNGRDDWALQMAGVESMMSGSRRMHGWVRVAPQVYGDDALRRQWLAAAIEFSQSLPEK
jgi:hypothetical protein